MKPVVAVLLLTSATFAATPCGVTLVESDPLVDAVVDEIRWRVYWFGTTAFAPTGRPSVTLLWGNGHAGYCAEGLDLCAIFRTLDGQILTQVDASRFEPEKESGVWVIKKAGKPSVRSSPTGGNSDVQMSVGGRKLSDPASSPKPSTTSAESLTLEFKTCGLDADLVGPMVPDAVRKRSRPQRASSLLKAIREQGLVQRSSRLVVPFFADRDSEVFLKIERPSGRSEILLVIQRSEGWWSLRPGSEIGTPGALSRIDAQIERAVMVTVMRDGSEAWTIR